MKILALEFSSDRRSAAVLAADPAAAAAPGVLGFASEESGRHTHAFALIETALDGAHLDRAAIECIAVGLGPGSYAGIRAAIAIAQGWRLARGVRLCGVSSVDCLVAALHAEGERGPVSVAIDAQRNEYYLADFELAADGWRELEGLRLVPAAQIEARLDAGTVLVGPEVGRRFPKTRTVYPDAVTLARLALRPGESASPDSIEPIYLRPASFVKAPPPRHAELPGESTANGSS